MATEIFYGNFGTGKTTAMLEKIKEAAERGERCILFVPEQFSFDAERTVYFAVGARNIRYVKVTGFSKLSREILNLYKAAKPCADNAVKLITMWRVIDEARKDFLSLARDKNSSGLCSLLLKTVSAFKNAGISPEDYKKILDTETRLDEELSDKAGDFLRIYTDYNSALTEGLDDKLDDVSKAAALAEEHGYFKGCRLFFDNYDSFSQAQKKLLSAALGQCDNAVFCLSCDSLQSRKREFLCVVKTANELKAIDPDTAANKFSRPYRKENRDENPVKLFSAKTPYDEAELIAAEIHRSVREEGKRYRDFLILTADSDYEEIIYDRLKCGGIPVFCDFPRPMTEKPIVNFVTLILKALELETEDILNLAESGFLRVRDYDENGESGKPRLIFGTEAYRLRLAAESYDIDVKDWERGFENDPRQELEQLENLRKGIAEPLITLKKELNNAEDGAELSRIFMNWLLEEQDITATFTAASKADDGGEVHTLETDEAAAEEIGRIWDALCEAFTSMAYCLEGKKISVEDYRLLLEEILSGINIANPPQVLDSVTLGDIERTRKSSPKTVIIAGFNEGKIPRTSHPESIFTDNERESLNLTGLPIYDSMLNRNSKEYYFAQRALSLYEKNLIITYSYQSADGRETAPSNILSSKEFKNLTVQSKEGLEEGIFINTAYDLRSAIASACGKDKEKAEELEKILSELKDKEYGERAADALTLLRAGRRFSLPEDIAQRLFGGRSYSPTSLEAAFSCPFMYFGKYGLELRENDSKDIEASNNKGTAIHNILCSVLSSTPDLADKSDGELESIAKAATRQEANTAIAADPTFPERTRAVFSFMLPRITNILKQIVLELKQGEFKPSEFEKEVSYKIYDEKLPQCEKDRSVTVKGTADRIDLLTEGDKEYVRIFDYKSGKEKTFSLNDAEQGENLQMLLYLFAECGKASEKLSKAAEKDDNPEDSKIPQSSGNKRERLPGGIGYFNTGAAKNYSAPGSSRAEQHNLDKEWYDGHRISGAVFDGNARLKEQTENYNKTVSANTKMKKGSDKFFSAECLSSEKFDELRQHIEKDIIVKKIISLLEGNIEALPLDKKVLPCEYCCLSSICGNKGKNVRSLGEGEEMNRFRAAGEKAVNIRSAEEGEGEK